MAHRKSGSEPPRPAARPSLDDPAERLSGVGPKRAALLERMGVRLVRDLLFTLPFDWFDRSRRVAVRDVRPDQNATLLVRVRALKASHTRSGKRALLVTVEDDTGQLDLIFFNRDYLARQMPPGTRLLVSGVLRWYERLRMAEPEYEILDGEEEAESGGDAGPSSGPESATGGKGLHTVGIVPHYRRTEGIGEKWLRTLVRRVVDGYAPALEDPLPAAWRSARGLVDLGRAIADAHFPPDFAARDAALRRLAYDELLELQCLLAIRRRNQERRAAAFSRAIEPELDRRIRARFPFRFTPAQNRAAAEIAADLARPHPMNRLLQGDVGAGKTAVALYAALAAVACGQQVAVMAPTEILARQHADTFARLLEGSRVTPALLIGGLSKAQRRAILERLFSGEIDLVVGTHALIEEDVAFRSLGLAVIDEQHRFGVVQRALLRRKGPAPHVLVMTATPIPRTLAMTVFGDLDVSTLDELPPGRKPVRTFVRTRESFDKAMAFVRERIAEGRQAYFIYPLIDDSPKLALRSATAMHRDLASRVFPGVRIELLTGATPSEEKERIMTEFRSGAIAVLVSTVVIEVGIDVPNATVMVVDHADRFGLAQLHQLRGRIGRGGEQAYCILFAEESTPEGERRLRLLEETQDGFKIAEADLGFRGPGEFLGVRQSGLPEFRVARLERDFALLQESRKDALRLLAEDPRLERPEHAALRAGLCARYEEVRALAGE